MLKPGAIFYQLILRTIVFLFCMTLARILFWLFNANLFINPSLSVFLHGIQFDLIATTIVLGPYYLILNLPFDIEKFKWVKLTTRFYFMIALALFLLLNCIDMIYFDFTMKRSTWDLFEYISTGDDALSLIPQFLKDYWYMAFVFATLVIIGHLLLKKVELIEFPDGKNLFIRLFFNVILAFFIFIAARGGFQLKPMNIMDASRYTSIQNIPLMLNTPFTILKTYNTKGLEYVDYFRESDECLAYFDPKIEIKADSTTSYRNIVIIIMESLSKEYVGYYNSGDGYTPFLDSLMLKSTVFENAFANGKRSIEALPAIFSSLPNLMNNAYNISPYSSNNLSSIVHELKKYNYSSSFFHGGKNGTMGFDTYTNLAGFDQYFGLDEYPDHNDFDGNWGVFDLPYFRYFSSEQNKMKEPFISSIFSLSAHHPYKKPENFNGKRCKSGRLPILPLICYADHALASYFKLAKQQPWYNNTIFIVTADHTAQNLRPEYDDHKGQFSIPLLLFDPANPAYNSVEKVTQQTDIAATILDYLKIEAAFVGFGQSALSDDNEGFALNYLGGIYQYIDKKYAIYFNGEEVVVAIDYTVQPDEVENLAGKAIEDYQEAVLKMKAIIQIYNQRLIDNQLTLDE